MKKMHPPYDEWLATRPESVQKLAREFPFQGLLTIKGEEYQIIGYTESDVLIIAPLSARSYEEALERKQYIHAEHLRKGEGDATFQREQ